MDEFVDKHGTTSVTNQASLLSKLHEPGVVFEIPAGPQRSLQWLASINRSDTSQG